jgi:small subunit ribosomal protein S2
VGTKKQTQGPIASYADACGMPYVNERWLGGMLTNFQTVSTRVKRMKEFEAMEKAGDFEAMPKKEALRHSRELEKLQRNLGGIRGLDKLPDAIFVIDTNKEHIAVTEANKLKIPVIAVVDTNVDPDVIQFPIPGNDDAIRAVALLTRVIADAVADGLMARAGRGSAAADEGVVATDEPLAAWEAELLAGTDSPVEVPTSAAEELATEVAAEEPVAGSAEADAEASAAAAIAETPDEAAAEVAAEAVADAETTEAPADQA